MKLELTENEINIVMAGLGKLPLEMSINVFSVIQKQIQDDKENKPAAD